MLRGRHDCHVIEREAVDVALTWQTLQRVALALDLVSVEAAIYDGKIHPHHALTEAQFIQDQRIKFGLVTTANLRVKTAADVNVANLCARHLAAL